MDACRTCTLCKYAEWDYVDAYRGGYWAVCGCNMPSDAPITDETLITSDDEDWNDEWGDSKDCPYFDFEPEEIDPDYERYLDVEIKQENFN